MKKHYNSKIILFILAGAFFQFQIYAQIRLVQVNPASDTVTIHNFGGSTVDISSYWFCSLFSYTQLNNGSLTIVNGSLNLNSNSDVTISGFSLNNAAADLGLYNSPSFASTSAMQDFTQWGSSNNGRENVAVSKGIWEDDAFISVSPPYEYTGNGSQNGVNFWGTVLGIEDFKMYGFTISPNPARSRLVLQLPTGLEAAKVEVFDVLGKEIYNTKFNHAPIDITDWGRGVYMVRVSLDDIIQTKRFIKQ